MANLKTDKIKFQKGVSSTSDNKERVSLQTIIHTAKKTQDTFKIYKKGIWPNHQAWLADHNRPSHQLKLVTVAIFHAQPPMLC